MKEKTADIDILEEKEKKAINNLNFIVVTDIYGNEVSIDKTKIINEYNESVGIVLNLVKTLIAENKELKDSNVELATTIDCLQTDLKEINEEYNAEQKHEMENTIPKSKAKEEINGKFKEAKGLYERGVQPQAQYTMKLLRDLEQSLLGKE